MLALRKSLQENDDDVPSCSMMGNLNKILVSEPEGKINIVHIHDIDSDGRLILK
jgi:hypothetical protein